MMTRPKLATDVRLMSATVNFTDERLRTPLYLSGGAISELTLAHASVTVADAAGRQATGQGMVYLSDLWAWPSAVSHAERDAAMRGCAREIAAQLPAICDSCGHPVELGWALHAALPEMRPYRAGQEPMPVLAVAVCASPFDAALHDAFGRLHGQSSYTLLGPDCLPGDLGRFLGQVGEGATLEQTLNFDWRPRVPGCVVVGTIDPLTPAEVTTPVGDGLPECLADWVRRYGYVAVKIKPPARDPREDAARTSVIWRVLSETHQTTGHPGAPWISVDPNECYPDVDAVLAFLAYLREIDADAYHALRYLEQPLPRALSFTRDLSPAAAMKPILADECLTSPNQLPTVRRAGWSGIAVKTCKGQTACLLLAAYCHLTGQPYAIQDLTNPALAAIQSLGLAARMRSINGIELNAVQYSPAANRALADRHPGVFTPRDGCHDAASLTGPGLGYGF